MYGRETLGIILLGQMSTGSLPCSFPFSTGFSVCNSNRVANRGRREAWECGAVYMVFRVPRRGEYLIMPLFHAMYVVAQGTLYCLPAFQRPHSPSVVCRSLWDRRGGWQHKALQLRIYWKGKKTGSRRRWRGRLRRQEPKITPVPVTRMGGRWGRKWFRELC